MILMSLKAKPKGEAIEYYGHRYGYIPCIPPGAMAEMNCRLRWKNQKPKLKPVVLPFGWDVYLRGGGIQRPVDYPRQLRSGPQSM